MNKSRLFKCYFSLVSLCCAFALPNENLQTVFKLVLLVQFFGLITLGAQIGVRIDKRLIIYLCYFFFCCFFIRQVDFYSIKFVFNNFIIIAASIVLYNTEIKRQGVWLILIVLTFFIIWQGLASKIGGAYKFQIHTQIWNWSYVLLCWSTGLLGMLVVIISSISLSIRSSFGGALYIFISKKIKTPYVHLFILVLALFLLIALNVYLPNLGGSFMWRIWHWNEILGDFTISDFLFGKGIGYSLRSTLSMDNFYTTGEAVIDTHSHYVKIIADTGLIGLTGYGIMIVSLYKRVNSSLKKLILYYLFVGLVDDGIWQASFFWILALGYNSQLHVLPGKAFYKLKVNYNDIVSNYHQRQIRVNYKANKVF